MTTQQDEPFPLADDLPSDCAELVRRELERVEAHLDARFDALEKRLERKLSRTEARDAFIRHLLTAGGAALAARYPDVAEWLAPLLQVIGGG